MTFRDCEKCGRILQVGKDKLPVCSDCSHPLIRGLVAALGMTVLIGVLFIIAAISRAVH